MSVHFHPSLKTPTASNYSVATAPARRSWLAAILKAPARLWREIQLRRATRKLEGLDDRALSDIGISRADIERAVRTGRTYPTPYL
jgi:uncharacterized protein YjiS (DUF1127 family)